MQVTPKNAAGNYSLLLNGVEIFFRETELTKHGHLWLLGRGGFCVALLDGEAVDQFVEAMKHVS